MTLVICYGLKYYLTLSLLIATKEKINQQFTFHKILRNKYSTICNNTFMLLIAHCIIMFHRFVWETLQASSENPGAVSWVGKNGYPTLLNTPHRVFPRMHYKGPISSFRFQVGRCLHNFVFPLSWIRKY